MSNTSYLLRDGLEGEKPRTILQHTLAQKPARAVPDDAAGAGLLDNLHQCRRDDLPGRQIHVGVGPQLLLEGNGGVLAHQTATAANTIVIVIVIRVGVTISAIPTALLLVRSSSSSGGSSGGGG